MIPRLKSLLPFAMFGLLTAGWQPRAAAQSDTTLATFYAIGLEHAQNPPYDFTGRVFVDDDAEQAIGTGTLLRRHTVLTAGHVVYNPTEGFIQSASFSRGRYGNYDLSDQQVTSVQALAGYQSALASDPNASSDGEDLATLESDLGLMIVTDPPVDNNWGNYDADPTQLTNNAGRFILGYPGVTFDGRTMAYIVPTAPYVEMGLTATGAYSNELYIAEPGFSGGPVYAVVNNEQVVVAELTAGADDATGEFNAQFVRAFDTTAAKFFQDAEYNAGLIKKVKIAGPTTPRGVKLTYTLTVKFLEPNVDGSAATTNRYPELKLKADQLGTVEAPTTVTKISNTQFQVYFSPTLQAGVTVNLTGYFDKGDAAPKSTLAVLLQ